MQDKFDDMSNNLMGKIDDMGIDFYLGHQIDDIEKSLNDMMQEVDIDDTNFDSDEDK